MGPPHRLSGKMSREKNVVQAARTQCPTPGSSPGPATWLLGAVTGAPVWGQTDSGATICDCLHPGVGVGWGGREWGTNHRGFIISLLMTSVSRTLSTEKQRFAIPKA